MGMAVSTYSQTILNQSETTTRTIEDSHVILLAPGFSASSSVSNPFIARISDSEGVGSDMDSNAGSDNPSGTTDSAGNKFHDTQGNIEVNGGGQLQFTLPVALPPGIKSVAPQINLVYTSGSGNGIAGYGWSISGITSISRMGKTIEVDSEVKGVKLDYTDYYSFNGQRLILKSGVYGKDGAEYATEKFSNVKITSKGTISGQAWQGPEYWEVTFEDGSQAWYGNTATGTNNARTPIEYNIVKWKDAQGNYITYTYSQSNNVAVISSIQWGGNETLSKSHFNTITFNYITRDLKESSYIKGINFIQEKLLSNIVVNASGSQFKKYVVTYTKDIVNDDTNQTLNYQFVKNVQEFNSLNEPANPITFNTKSLITSTQERAFTDFSNVITSGDYNGDGLIDFVVKQSAQNGKPEGYYLYFDKLNNESPPFLYLGSSSSFSNLRNFTIKSKNNIIEPRQGFVTIENIYNTSNPQANGGIEIKCYSINMDASILNTFSNPLILEYSNFIDPSTYQAASSLYSNFPPANYGYYIKSDAISPTEIDINFDGIPELVFTLFDKGYYKRQSPAPYEWVSIDLGYRYIVVDYDDFASNSSVFTKINTPTTTNILESANVMDFDNDKVQDILKTEYPNYNNYANTNVTFYTKNKYSNATIQRTVNTPVTVVSQYFIIRSGSGNNKYTIQLKKRHSIKGLRKEIKFGDLNGDGNIEVITPLEKNLSGDSHIAGWSFYLNNGKELTEFCQGFIEYYNDDYISNGYFQKSQNGVIDIDNDGKSDFLHFYSGYNTQGNGFSNLFLFKYSDFQYDSSNNQFRWAYKQYNLITNRKGGNTLVPIYGDFRINNSNSKILFLSNSLTNNNDRKVISYQNYNLNVDKNPTSISQGGITTSIDYKELDPTVNPDFYAQTKKEQYPYVELERVSQSYAVSQLRQTIPVNGVNEIRKQDFRYRGLITHLQGKGMIGFRQTARSSWYADGFEGTKIWSGAEIDPLNEGVPIKEWSVKTNTEAQIFPTNLSESNTNLLSFKSTTYQNNKLLNGNVVTSYGSADKPKIVTALIPLSSVSKDFMKDIRTESTITYDSNYLPTKTVRNVNSGFAVSTTDLEYNNNASGTGKDYYIGRPKTKTETVQVYSDTKSGKEEYTYENNLLKTLKTYNRDNTGWFLETYAYDGFGNVTQKNITSSIDSNIKTDKTQYDDKGRFVMKKIDNLNLVTTITYNDWGQVLTQTDPLGNSVTNEYDGWGKLLKSKNKLSGYTTYTYEKDSNGNTIVKEYLSDGGINISYTNKIGQVYKKTSKSFGSGKYISAETKYDVLGRKISESEPYFEGASASQWNTIEYDEYSRPIKATAFTGKIVTSVYSGRVVTTTETNANNRFKKQTSDPIGNITSSEDLGGVINFKYNAAGENTEASYGGNVVTTAYDAWGNKVSLDDPSNGKYEYTYAGYFGSISKTKSPKGEKTYTYNSKGQLTTQTEKTTDGTNNTDKTISITYDNNGLITAKSGTSLGKSYSSGITYDSFGRVLSSYENSNGKYYMRKGITYDDQSRVVSYEKSLYSSGVYTKVTIQNVYDTWSGEMYQVKNKSTGKVLWELQQTNAKGQVEKAKLGGTNINNLYGTNGYLISSNQTSALDQSTLLQVSYTFNAIKNELTGRTRGGDFNILESFEYDSNNRLTKWTNPATGLNNTNTYDVKGRITNNDQVGNVKYETTGKIYRPSGMTLNSVGEQNYTNDLVQSIVYNENNDPVFIDGLKGDVAFEYGLTGMRQVAYYGGNFDQPSGNEQPDSKFTKYYSEDGSYEIIRNNQTGKEKHLLYIGGSPYESNIVYLKDYDSGSGKFVFLHKDYLGSILAISDESGTGIEQRHYDAWGNLTHLKIGTAAIITDKTQIYNYLAAGSLVVERGYTSHEHFVEVSLIHMNGRLYDPLLRRFLNADENIQDPYNTQNYNKYGYVLNNPLMYNDPSGEFIWFLPLVWAAEFLVVNSTAIIVGAAIGAAMYLGQSAMTGNFSWGGFGKSIFMGALTGAVSAGLGQVFSSSGFWAAVGNGALAGAGSGGVTSLINGTNFLEGLAKGAVIGGAIGGISYTVSYYTNPRVQELTKAEYDSHGIEDSGTPLDPSIKTLREMYHNTGWDEMNTGAKQFYVDRVSNGYTKSGNLYLNPKGEEVIAYTRRNFWDGNTSSISFSKYAFGSKIKLGITMMHELGHSTLNLNNSLTNFLQYKTNKGYEPEMLPSPPGSGLPQISIEHGAIWGVERDFLIKNGLKNLPGFFDSKNNIYFNSWFLPGQQYNRVYEYIKHLSVKLK